MDSPPTLPRERPPGPTTTLADLLGEAVRLRLAWTTVATDTLQEITSTDSYQQTDKQLINDLELWCVHILYYDSKAGKLGHMVDELDAWLKRYDAGIWAAELSGEKLREELTEERKANAEQADLVREGIDGGNVRFSDVEDMYEAVCLMGPRDLFNSEEPPQDVTALLRVFVAEMDGYNTEARRAFSLVVEVPELSIPEYGCYGNHLAEIKEVLLEGIREALDDLAEVWEEDDGCRSKDVIKLRRLAVALKDVETLRAYWVIPTKEDVEAAAVDLVKIAT